MREKRDGEKRKWKRNNKWREWNVKGKKGRENRKRARQKRVNISKKV